MTRYTDWQLNLLAASAWDRRPAAVPTVPLDAWVLANAAPICPVTDAPCTRGCHPAEGPCERQEDAP